MALIDQVNGDGFFVESLRMKIWEATSVELYSEFGFFPFGLEIGQKGFEYCNSFDCSNLRHEQISMLDWIFEVSRSVVVKDQAEEIAHGLDRSGIGHFNAKRECVSVTSALKFWPGVGTRSFNRDATFPVNQSGKIGKLGFIIHAKHGTMKSNQNQGLHKQNRANSVELPLQYCKDNTEPNPTTGEVCREHIRDSKEMMCSDLPSNRKSAAEMTAPAEKRVTKVQDASTCHILWMGASTVSNRRKQGVMGSITNTYTS
jgi:hypothetical protein